MIDFCIDGFCGFVTTIGTPHVEVLTDNTETDICVVEYMKLLHEISDSCWLNCYFEFCNLMESDEYQKIINTDKKDVLQQKLIEELNKKTKPLSNNIIRFQRDNLLSYKIELFVDTYFAAYKLSKHNNGNPLFTFDVRDTENDAINTINNNTYKNNNSVKKLIEAFVKAYNAAK